MFAVITQLFIDRNAPTFWDPLIFAHYSDNDTDIVRRYNYKKESIYFTIGDNSKKLEKLSERIIDGEYIPDSFTISRERYNNEIYTCTEIKKETYKDTSIVSMVAARETIKSEDRDIPGKLCEIGVLYFENSDIISDYMYNARAPFADLDIAPVSENLYMYESIKFEE